MAMDEQSARQMTTDKVPKVNYVDNLPMAVNLLDAAVYAYPIPRNQTTQLTYILFCA